MIKPYTYQETRSAIKKILDESNQLPESIKQLRKTYDKFRESDPRFPSNPGRFYAKSGWRSFQHLFGLPEKEFYTYQEAQSVIQQLLQESNKSLALVTNYQEVYHSLRKLDTRLPSAPHKVYANSGWIGHRGLFGLPDNLETYTYKEAQRAIKSLLKKSNQFPELLTSLQKTYKTFRKLDVRFPANPGRTYMNTGWKSYEHLFMLPEKIGFYTFQEAQLAIKKHLKASNNQSLGALTPLYESLRKIDNRLPSAPTTYYAQSGCQSLRHLFGLPENIELYSYEEAQNAIQKALKKSKLPPEKLNSLGKYYQMLRDSDSRFPSTPGQFYAKTGWQSINHLFGLPEKVALYTFQEARSVLERALKKLNQQIDYKTNVQELYHKIRESDKRLPSYPNRDYANSGWLGMRHFLGLPDRGYYTYKEAQNAIKIALDQKGLLLEKLSSLSATYIKLREDDERYPSVPEMSYRNKGWIGYEYLFERKRFYSFGEACEKVKNRTLSGIDIKHDYGTIRLNDPMLPPMPESAYFEEWRTWEYFYGISDGLYETLAEAQTSALKIAKNLDLYLTAKTYAIIRKEDTRLPSKPDKYLKYKNDWNGWAEFSGRHRKNLYSTVEDAQTAAKNLNLTTSKKYNENYHLDLRLPADPVRYFNLKSYNDFIGFRFWNVEEVREYCLIHKISSISDYKTHARNHLHLKFAPHRIDGYERKEDILYKPSSFEQIADLGFDAWADIANRWTKTGRNRDVRIFQIREFLLYLISKDGLSLHPYELFIKGTKVTPLAPHIETLALSRRKNAESIITKFFDEALIDTCYDRDEETGELIPVSSELTFRNPYAYSDVADTYQYRPNESTKPPLDFIYVEQARKYLVPDVVRGKDGNSIICTNFSQLHNAQELFSGDWVKVDKPLYELALDDPNCPARTREISSSTYGRRTETVYEIWSPVRTMAMYVLLSLPLRGIQIVYLDSGEADEYKLVEDGSELIWIRNDNPLAGQLKKSGFLYKSQNDTVGMKVSTNKTSYYEGGYTVPYMPDDVARWMIRLRDWQSKYNPLTEPTRWFEIKQPRKVDKKLMKKRGAQCFLFRDMVNTDRGNNPAGSQPMTTNKAFKTPLAKLLYQIQDDELPLAHKKSESDSFTNYHSIYTPHSLRVSHISALLFEGDGIDPIIVQKLVGHASLVMTIYYAKIGHERMREKLDAKYKEVAANAQKQYQISLMEKSIEEAKGELIFSTGCDNLEWEKSAIRFKDFGLCPVANGLCHEGGLKSIRKNQLVHILLLDLVSNVDFL
ncbi:VPA1269 family protein [Vibrio natriegens]|uniref:VPA1269 family protein n=1 Tax=Vibrio natriegens TaxID=691 RepID=UPI003557A8B9